MTIAKWLTKYPDVDRMVNGEGLLVIFDVYTFGETQARELWHLADMTVSSASCGNVRLCGS